MGHVDPDTLALQALGEDAGDPVQRAHLAACARCRAYVGSLASATARARALTVADRILDLPPARAWEGIAAATGVATSPPRESSGNVVDLAERSRRAHADVPPPPEPADRPGSPAGRAGRWPRWLGLAAAAGLVLVVAVSAVLVARPEPAGEIVATTPLDPLDADAPGEARLVAVDDGLALEVEPPPLPPTDGYYALWLIDTDVEQMVSLGPVAEDGLHALPAGLDPGDFPVVDISREPFDGDPAHSGDSVLRGILPVGTGRAGTAGR